MDIQPQIRPPGEISTLDALALLRLQIEWGADEAILDQPLDRLRPLATPFPVMGVAPTRLAGAEAPGPVPEINPVIHAPTVQRRAVTPTTPAPIPAASAATLDELRAAITAFTGCPLRDSAAHTILPEGDATARLIVVGEAPSADDDRAGRVFAGPLGEFLDRTLATIGLTREDLLLTPLLPWRPPGDRPPSPGELSLCLPFLWRLLALATSPYALILGPVATRALAGAKRVKRGTWTELPVSQRSASIKILSSTNLSQIKRIPAMKREFWSDLRKISCALN
ncbi:MAG: uracil-DNA glycosylase [Acetobacteraceae bacterium]|nr:uracil-DNA glycosylase [Acetobacteraceae bacterium]